MIFIIFSLLNKANATLGISLSTEYGVVTDFSCKKKAGYDFAIIQGYRSPGGVDLIGLANLRKAKGSGLIADVYFDPCMGRGRVAVDKQVTDFVNAFGYEYGTVWVAVGITSATSCAWAKDINANCAFLEQIVQRFKDYKKIVGIISGAHAWETIFGNRANCPYFTDLPLGYFEIDNNPSFSDYEINKFGGWIQPSIKLYGGTQVCGPFELLIYS